MKRSTQQPFFSHLMSSHLMSFFSVFRHNLAIEQQCKAFVLYNYHLYFSYFPEFHRRNRHKLSFETFQGYFFSSFFFFKGKGGKPKRNSLKPPNSRILHIHSHQNLQPQYIFSLCGTFKCAQYWASQGIVLETASFLGNPEQ